MQKNHLKKILIITTIMLISLFYLMTLNFFIVVNINGIPIRDASFFVLGLIIITMAITTVLLIKDSITKIKKTSKKIHIPIAKVFFKYLISFTLISALFFFSSLILLVITEQTNSYVLSKKGSYYYEYFPACIIPDSRCKCYRGIKTERKNFYKVSRYIPIIGFPISANKFYRIKGNSKIILDECHY